MCTCGVFRLLMYIHCIWSLSHMQHTHAQPSAVQQQFSLLWAVSVYASRCSCTHEGQMCTCCSNTMHTGINQNSPVHGDWHLQMPHNASEHGFIAIRILSKQQGACCQLTALPLPPLPSLPLLPNPWSQPCLLSPLGLGKGVFAEALLLARC